MTISSPVAGAIAICRTGRFEVLAIEGDKVILLHPEGRVRVPTCKVLRFDQPAPTISPESVTTTPHHPLAVGKLTQADYLDAVSLVEVADNREAIEAVRSALTQVFTAPAEKRRLWDMLNPQQREKLSI